MKRFFSLLILVTLYFVPPSVSAGAVAEQPDPDSEGTAILRRFQSSFRAVARKVIPVVVEVNVEEIIRQPDPEGLKEGSPDEREFRRPGLGSGVIVRRDGEKVYVLTNNHVIGDADEISVSLYNGRKFEAATVGRDERKDLALLVFTSEDAIPVAELGNSDELKVGDWVIAVGNPLGLESTMTAGIVSALNRRGGPGNNISDFIQTDAAINPGNSGGALVNIHGQLIGINTWIASTTGNYMGFGFAIPINNAKKAINDFIETGIVIYGWLGVMARDQQPGDPKGALVMNLYRDSPAGRTGFLPGDIITRVNNGRVKSADDLIQIVGDLEIDSLAHFEAIRNGEKISLPVKISVREDEQKLIARTGDLWPGMLVEVGESPAESGKGSEDTVVWIVQVFRSTRVYRAGFKRGDIILEIDGRQVKSLPDYFQALNKSDAGLFKIKILRQKEELIITLIKDPED